MPRWFGLTFRPNSCETYARTSFALAQPGRYSGSSGPVPGDDVLIDMRAPIVGRDNFAIERDLLRLPAL
jgi:hypothetical protein